MGVGLSSQRLKDSYISWKKPLKMKHQTQVWQGSGVYLE
uniref:Uncharacterized protein n=1 Tax=Anguilla anguilla TaxID=7936 RepID=A0A0E9VFV7_ANGAN